MAIQINARLPNVCKKGEIYFQNQSILWLSLSKYHIHHSQITCFPLHWGSVQPDLTCGVNIANIPNIIPGTKIML